MATAKKVPGKNGFKYRPQYGVIVICTDEKHQQNVFQTLAKKGLKLKVVTV